MFSRPPHPARPWHRRTRPLVAEKVFGGHRAGVELDLAGRLGTPAHLVLQRAEGQPGDAGLDQKGGDAARAAVAGARAMTM